ncbi:MAG: UMP kinase [Alphaproteobacteria bacterium]|nr:UMP kinase [Alphaproteobacteria bacterium]
MYLDGRRILYKLSGELLLGSEGVVDVARVQDVVDEIEQICALGRELIVVCGAGNILRGRSTINEYAERALMDAAGMMATYVNATVLSAYMLPRGLNSKVFGVFEAPQVSLYKASDCLQSLHEGVIFLVGGTGLPYFSTDTLAAVRASELHCDLFVKATSVDGVYTANPHDDPQAQKIDTLTYHYAIQNELNIMDLAAYSVMGQSGVPTVVFNRAKHTLPQLLEMKVPHSLITQE